MAVATLWEIDSAHYQKCGMIKKHATGKSVDSCQVINEGPEEQII
jgi:hypothetical protein